MASSHWPKTIYAQDGNLAGWECADNKVFAFHKDALQHQQELDEFAKVAEEFANEADEFEKSALGEFLKKNPSAPTININLDSIESGIGLTTMTAFLYKALMQLGFEVDIEVVPGPSGEPLKKMLDEPDPKMLERIEALAKHHKEKGIRVRISECPF